MEGMIQSYFDILKHHAEKQVAPETIPQEIAE